MRNSIIRTALDNRRILNALMPYRFRPVTQADVPLLRDWRLRPHVRQWWGPHEAEDPADVLAEEAVAMWIIEHDGRPFAYAQDYSPLDWDHHHFAHLPPGARGSEDG